MKKFLLEKPFTILAALFVGVMLVSGGGQAFAIDNAKMPTRPQKWSSFIRAGSSTPTWSILGKQPSIKLIKNVGASSPCIEMKDGKMAQVSSSVSVNNMVRIKTASSQRVEFVTWDSGIGNVQWDTIKAKQGTYWRVEPNSELVFDYGFDKKTIIGFWMRSGEASIDVNYWTIGEAVEFAETIAASTKYDKVKSEVAGWKSILDRNPKLNCPREAGGGNACGCKRDLVQHTINEYASDAALLGAALGALPTGLALAAEYTRVMPQYRKNAALAYAVACAYGKFPTQKQFELHLLKLLSGVDITQVRSEQINGMAGTVRDEMVEKAASALAKKIAPNLVSSVPGVGTAIGVTIGAITGASDAKDFGNKAKDYYR